MRVGMLLPDFGGQFRNDCLYVRESARSIARALSRRGFEIVVLPREEASRTSHERASEFLEEADSLDLIHGYCRPEIAAYAVVISTPMVVTIDGPLDRATLSMLGRYPGSVSCVCLRDKASYPVLKPAGTISPAIDADLYPFRKVPEDYVLCLSRMTGTKEIIAAADIASSAGRKLVVAGDAATASRFERIRPRLRNSTVEYRVLGPAEEIKLLSGASALLCIGSKPCYTIPLAVSMVLGTPVVSVNAQGLSEPIAEGVTGLISPSLDDGTELLSRVKEMDRQACRDAAAEQFSPEKVAEAYAALYTTIHEQKKREDHRPWGYYEVLADTERYKVKRIVVFPGKRLSLQKHNQRAEHWYVLSGEAVVRCGEREAVLVTGQSLDIPEKTLHRLQNRSAADLTIIEVQKGDYCGEDDIERFEDDFGRI